LEAFIPANWRIAPEVPMAMDEYAATGFRGCPTCSPRALQATSHTGEAQDVAAHKTSANSTILRQISGPYKPLPPDTTISASATATYPFTVSTDSTLISKGTKEVLKASSVAFPVDSTNPKELFDRPMIFTSVLICVNTNALLVKAVRLTVKGETEVGTSTTLDA